MNITTLKSDSLLLLTAAIWGFAFVAQRVGMDYVGPFTFNGVRFALGSLVLVPLILRNRKNQNPNGKVLKREEKKVVIFGGAILGITLFTAASLQQVGLVYTTAGNAGFITGLYVVIVPILGLFWKQRPDAGTWIGAFFAVIGLYFLSIADKFTISFGDLLELFGAFFWAGHVGWLSPKMDSLKLACTQFAACSVLSLFTALLVEKIVMKSIFQAALPILYGGVLSVGVAYTLQVVAQKKAHPAHAAIILSLEAVFAAFGGWLILDETLTSRGLLGCALMLSGMLLSQLWGLYGDGRSLIGQELK
ncbi:MAG: DMT family transporter [Deltaproteobacteria bacterium]|nr:DMT family transporter [Deltaproteobacteria bacterium]